MRAPTKGISLYIDEDEACQLFATLINQWRKKHGEHRPDSPIIKRMVKHACSYDPKGRDPLIYSMLVDVNSPAEASLLVEKIASRMKYACKFLDDFTIECYNETPDEDDINESIDRQLESLFENGEKPNDNYLEWIKKSMAPPIKPALLQLRTWFYSSPLYEQNERVYFDNLVLKPLQDHESTIDEALKNPGPWPEIDNYIFEIKEAVKCLSKFNDRKEFHEVAGERASPIISNILRGVKDICDKNSSKVIKKITKEFLCSSMDQKISKNITNCSSGKWEANDLEAIASSVGVIRGPKDKPNLKWAVLARLRAAGEKGESVKALAGGVGKGSVWTNTKKFLCALHEKKMVNTVEGKKGKKYWALCGSALIPQSGMAESKGTAS